MQNIKESLHLKGKIIFRVIADGTGQNSNDPCQSIANLTKSVRENSNFRKACGKILFNYFNQWNSIMNFNPNDEYSLKKSFGCYQYRWCHKSKTVASILDQTDFVAFNVRTETGLPIFNLFLLCNYKRECQWNCSNPCDRVPHPAQTVNGTGEKSNHLRKKLLW